MEAIPRLENRNSQNVYHLVPPFSFVRVNRIWSNDVAARSAYLHQCKVVLNGFCCKALAIRTLLCPSQSKSILCNRKCLSHCTIMDASGILRSPKNHDLSTRLSRRQSLQNWLFDARRRRVLILAACFGYSAPSRYLRTRARS